MRFIQIMTIALRLILSCYNIRFILGGILIKPAKPFDEAQRINSLQKLNILDTPLNPVFERITRLTKKMLDVPIVSISLIDTDRQWFKSEQGLNVCQTERDISFCGHAILQDDIMIIPDALQDQRFHDNPLVLGTPYIRFYAGCPIHSQDGYKIGTLCVIGTKPRNLANDEIETLQDMAALVEQQLHSQQQTQYQSKIMQELNQAKRDKLIDALTRIWNRDGIVMNFREHNDLAKINKNYLALTMIDIDNFKHVNDTYGHNAGDQVLREVTKRIVMVMNEKDVLGRWGGEEFLGIIAMQCDNPELCMEVFENARKNICAEPVVFNGISIPITASFGITVSKNLDDDLVEIVAKADHALYEAKNSGKNKCVLDC